jgi:hypothetical protein
MANEHDHPEDHFLTRTQKVSLRLQRRSPKIRRVKTKKLNLHGNTQILENPVGKVQIPRKSALTQQIKLPQIPLTQLLRKKLLHQKITLPHQRRLNTSSMSGNLRKMHTLTQSMTRFSLVSALTMAFLNRYSSNLPTQSINEK